MPITFRTELIPSDHAAIRSLVESTGVFNAVELDCAVELAEERVKKARPAAITSSLPSWTVAWSATPAMAHRPDRGQLRPVLDRRG